jgi:hypothetical protein
LLPALAPSVVFTACVLSAPNAPLALQLTGDGRVGAVIV